MVELNTDYISDIIDEIALEGLDGITLEGLWKRLSERPGFIFTVIDVHVHAFLWKLIKRLPNVSFYELATERAELFNYKRTDYIDSFGNFYEPEDMPPCIYPHCPVEDNGIMGSCSTYKKRKDITISARKEDYSYATSLGNKLVIVADQNTRSKAISSCDFNPVSELGVSQYCILERIARSRYEGEVTQGKRGLQVVTDDPKMLYYFRKLLVKNKLVQKQVFYMKVSKQTSTGSLIHLPRFYSEIKTRQDTDALKLIYHLQESPIHCIPMKNLKTNFNIDLKKILVKYPNNFITAQVPYRTLHPSCKPSEWKLKSTGEEKVVKVVKLVNSQIIKDDEDEEEDEEEIGLMDESRRRMDRSLMRQAYALVEQAGPRGIKQGALGCLLAVPSLQARSICKHLVRRKLVKTVLMDVGRQRITHFYCTKFDSAASSLTTEMKEEKNKLLQAISKSSELCDEYTNDLPSSSGLQNETVKDSPNADRSTVTIKEEVFEPPEALEKSKNGSWDEIEAEIIINRNESTSEKEKSSLTDEVRSLETPEASSLTARMLRRASLIVQAVNLHKVIQDTQKVQRIISDVEESEGMKQTIDRKTIQRLLDKLESDGLIRTIKVNLKGYGKEKSMLFICHPSVNETHSEIQSAIEQAKMKLPIMSAHHSKKKRKEDAKKTKLLPLQYDSKAGRRYGYKPKFVRMRILHMYMFYLIYGYDGDVNLDQSCKEEIIRKAQVDDSLLEEMSFVYHTEATWKMFLPPLPIHAEYPPGWCLLSDVLLCLPLCLFVNIVNVSYNIPELMDYLEHPIKKYFLLKNLPPDILHHLTVMRKYIFVVSEIVSRLGFIGLIQMGPQKLKEKDQIFIYLNRNAILYNTIPSDIGYNHVSQNKTYDCIPYNFYMFEDVEHYWYDLWNFAMNTNLGNRNSMTGQPVVVESVNTKKELLAAIQPKTIEEAVACDVGYIPGDNLGAGGLDSDMFVHLKRNWAWSGEKMEESHDQRSIICLSTLKQQSRIQNQKDLNSMRNAAGHAQGLKAIRAKEKETGKYGTGSDLSRSKLSKVGCWKSRAVSKKKTRVLMQRRTKFARKPYYDQKDKDALSRMVKLRVDWSPREDNLLLICKVASLYMSPEKRRQVAKNFCAVREILHSTYPTISRNKTSRACQRRMHYMMKNPSTAQSVYMCLEEIKQDPEITDKFHLAVEKLDALLKAQGEGPKGFQQEYDKIFMNLVSTLVTKLKTITNNDNSLFEIRVPQTIADFERKYEIVVPKPLALRYGSFNEVQKKNDILASVINAVIHSSLCCTTDKTSYSHQLFYIYQQYPDKLLRYVMTRCRSMSIVSCRKRYKRWKSASNDCLPLASSPYQLSISYVHILQTKYQYNIFSDCYNGLKKILNTPPVGSSGDPKVSINLEVSSGGECANIVELFSAGLVEMHVEFPDQLIVLDPRLSETEESYKLIMKRFKEMLTIINDPRKNDSKTILSDDEEEEEDIVVDKNLTGEKEPYFEQFNLKNKTGVANTASRLALYLMRDEPLEQLDKSLQHAHDFFVLNPCKVTVDVDKTKAEKIVLFKENKLKLISDVKRLAVFPGEPTDNDSVIRDSEKFPEETTLPLLEFLESKGELGATNASLLEKFEYTKDFENLLFHLVDEQIILRTGLVNIRFIHSKFCKPWLVKSFYLLRLAREKMDTPSTNSAYAISFTDSSLKRKNRNNATSEVRGNDIAETSVESISPSRKKLKTSHTPVCTENEPPCSSSTTLDTECLKDSSPKESSPARKKQKLDSESVENSSLGDHAPSSSKDKEVSLSSETREENRPETEESRFLMRSTNRRWVAISNENVKKFTNFDTSEVKNVFVKVRPWIKIDGTLNRRVLDRQLGCVLGHCLTCPGITVKKLQARFVPALQPVHTFELLEILVKIECLKLFEIKKSWKSSLFSKRVEISTEPSSGVDDTADIIVEPDPLAVSRLGNFIGDKNYSIDYLEALSDTKFN